MKKQNMQLKVYKRNIFGILRQIDSFDKNRYYAIISTSGVLRICDIYEKENKVIAAYASGEWHYVTMFKNDFSLKD
jgi:hypothetical protein